ncbi:hypothetical protein [Huintestinicola sp.]|uniref:hypothetical protein n=1 Tax=Huintestinicola sp. TaxID=2981661 RepID=UPI003D7DB616
MEIKFSEIMELARKAALLDGVVRFVKASKYSVSKEEILAIVGEPEDDSKDGDGDV